MTRILIIGKSGRIDCIAYKLYESKRKKEIYAISEVNNPGLIDKCVDDIAVGKTDDVEFVLAYARKVKPDFVFIGPEEPLEAGVVDAIQDELGIPVVGPRKGLAQIETSKLFTRKLIDKYKIPGNPSYKQFSNSSGLRNYLSEQGTFVVKADGLCGGKGVKVFGEHLNSIDEAMEFCQEVFSSGQTLVIEEKLVGEEFSLQAFCDGNTVVNTLPIQDHKRAYSGDSGPNTGGMGSYSCADHLLPFLAKEYFDEACQINELVAAALKKEFNVDYKGILYGGFMITSDGLKLIEYNARFGDPEVMNLLPLLKTDFIDICEAIIDGTLANLNIEFKKLASVCKYVVPESYPLPSTSNGIVDVPDEISKIKDGYVFYGAVNRRNNKNELFGSRAIGCVGLGETLIEAEKISEKIASSIVGPVRYRKDIGTKKLIQKRVSNINQIINSATQAM